MDWPEITKSTVQLFAIVNPIGSIPIFLQITSQMERPERQRAFRTGVLSALAILLIFIVEGWMQGHQNAKTSVHASTKLRN